MERELLDVVEEQARTIDNVAELLRALAESKLDFHHSSLYLLSDSLEVASQKLKELV